MYSVTVQRKHEKGRDDFMTKEKIKEKLMKVFQFFANPRLLLCLGIGWIITNGWSYVLLAVGTIFKIKWLIVIAGSYMTFLWFPFTPEKLVTVIIAMFLLKRLFPNDKKTLGILRELRDKVKKAWKNRKQRNKNGSNSDSVSL